MCQVSVPSVSAAGRSRARRRTRQNARTQISYAATAGDPLAAAGAVKWTPVTDLAGSTTSGIPAASAVGPHGTGPLLLAYKAPHTIHVLYRTLAGGTWSAPATVPGAQTVTGPALLRGQLATTSPTSAGNIFFHFFS